MQKFLRSRQQQEEMELTRLAVYAQTSQSSRSRRYPEPEHPWRTCYQRDRDRIIHSAAFRRLEAKTQVFFATGNDYYRTRLTHTMEVAQISRTLARILGVNEDLAEAVALAHDLGHPPYGHCGEAVLDELMVGHGGFEHNQQSLRIVDYLEHPYPSFRGLNLTFETRLCLARHETRYDKPETDREFGSDHAPLEGQIADLADAIAYNSHDLDDALAAGLIQEEDLQAIALYQEIKEQVEDQYPQAHPFAQRLRCAKGLIDLLSMDAIEEAAVRLERWNPKTAEDIRNTPEKMIALSPIRQQQLDQLQQFLYEKVYYHPQVSRAREIAQAELNYLFTRYLDQPELLPPRYQQRIEQQGRHRVICDYLAGMTDRFCHQLYEQRITG